MKGETQQRILLAFCYFVLRKEKININKIALELGLDWHTVDKYVQQLSFIHLKGK